MKPKVNMKINNGLPKRQDWAERIKMETKDKATARPWQVMEHKTTPFVADAAGWCITNGRLKRELRANANLIVRAVNSHEELLSALKWLKVASGIENSDIVNDAIAKAEGRES